MLGIKEGTDEKDRDYIYIVALNNHATQVNKFMTMILENWE
jgi:hypothetical protein